jgi:hypothetical protein
MEAELFWGIAFTVAVVGVCGVWFYRCGHADKTRQLRPFANRTFFYAGPGFLLGLTYVTADLGPAPMGLIAFTTCCGLLLYSAGYAAITSDDRSLQMVNLTGRAILLTSPELGPFYTLPAPQEQPADQLPPLLPRTQYIVTAALGHLCSKAGRTDVFTVDAATSTDYGEAGLLVRRLVAVPLVAPAGESCPGKSNP